jgi:protein-S-isoprenylcysteine O-methyltransferase Ste14
MVLFYPAHQLRQIPAPWLYMTSTLQVFALVGIFLSFRQIDMLAFVGLRQLVNPEAERESELVNKGLYRFVRHPLYFFSMIILWLFPRMTDVGLAFVIASTLYFPLGTIPEEQKLLKIYGDQYRRYQGEVPRIIPTLK